jgi:hypothetical protein
MNSEDVPELQGAEPTTDHARQRMISGRVTDKATGAPIASFRVTPGVSLLGDPYLDPSRAIDGNDGSYKFYFERKISDPALKIEAQGYLPMISGTLARGATHCDFAMTKGEPPSAVLLGDPAGARPSGLVIDVKNREENWIADDTETLEARRRAFGKVADSPAPEAGATLADTSEFVKYMSNPPWIRRMTYAHWQKYSWANKPSDPATTKWQMDTNLAGIQPSGFFEQQLSIPPAGFGRSDGGHKQICGMCDRYFWNAVESFHQVILWSGTNITWGVGREAFVQKIRHFGLPPLRPNSFTLGNDGHFSAATREGEAVHGRILEVAGSRPLALTYTVGDSTNEFTATYGYHSTNGLPSYVEFSVPVVTKKFRANVTHMASINQVEYGEDPRISAGYRPSQFFPDMAAFTKIQVFKDDGRFALDRNGTLTKISN